MGDPWRKRMQARVPAKPNRPRMQKTLYGREGRKPDGLVMLANVLTLLAVSVLLRFDYDGALCPVGWG